ncbi:MAG: HEAT repeat protein [candidate division TA06 bacterium ADurb.Bin417]|uniref:HEAT repeat protein n=1 Tax=candidate division TA06 bacterium ADurb.Bin417 TaxID=1852828 RepID=A0A1V5MKG9_UNCT6|nr:MAG: HEAT repeat protein [candidate division TA06 bacterium ADurb.Bin417]
MRAKAALPELEKLLAEDSEDRVRRAAAYAFLNLDPDGFRSRLSASQNDRVSIICLEILARQEREKALPELERLIRSASAPVRLAALAELGSIGGSEAVGILFRLVEETRLDSRLQVEALVRLGELAELDAVERLTKLAEKESDPSTRRLILDTAGRIEKRTNPDRAR